MTDKLAVEIVIPIIGKTLEFIIPSTMKMDQAKKLILKTMVEKFPILPDDESNVWLVDFETKKSISSIVTCEETGIKNGSRLLLLWLNE